MTSCIKTLTGKHLFMPIEWDEKRFLEILEVHGITKPLKCVFCGVIDDTQRFEES